MSSLPDPCIMFLLHESFDSQLKWMSRLTHSSKAWVIWLTVQIHESFDSQFKCIDSLEHLRAEIGPLTLIYRSPALQSYSGPRPCRPNISLNKINRVFKIHFVCLNSQNVSWQLTRCWCCFVFLYHFSCGLDLTVVTSSFFQEHRISNIQCLLQSTITPKSFRRLRQEYPLLGDGTPNHWIDSRNWMLLFTVCSICHIRRILNTNLMN